MSLEVGKLETGNYFDNLTVNEIVDNITINEIIDNTFIDKDVSELVKGDFYLFHVVGDVVYFYKDGVVFYSSVVDDSEVVRVQYTKGSLQEFVDYI